MTAGWPIFVVGAPRTGTTLVKEILNRHPRIHLFDEVHFFERIWDDRHQLGDLGNPAHRIRVIRRLRGIIERFGSDAEVAELLTPEEFGRRIVAEGGGYRGLLAALLKAGAELRGARLWGDSSPQDVLYLSTILHWYPEARIVALVRDPRGFLSSYKNYFRRNISSYRERYNPVTNSILWRSYMTATLEARRRWEDSVHVLRYEELVDDPEGRVRRLCEHIGVDFDPAMIDVEAANTSFVGEAGKSKGIFATSRDRWRTELTPTEIWVGERVFGRVMHELGYEPASVRGPVRPSPIALLRILAFLPGRLFNLLFRSHKPFKMSKVRRVLSLFRSG